MMTETGDEARRDDREAGGEGPTYWDPQRPEWAAPAVYGDEWPLRSAFLCKPFSVARSGKS